ncbi:hypothetical protein [Methylobacterium durans]|nr:hypothetical protein [Methylobacterium durans]
MADGWCDTLLDGRPAPEGRGLAGRLSDVAVVAGALGLALILILVGA